MRIFFAIVALTLLLFGGSMFWQALSSRKAPGNTGLVSGQLKACSGKPNCVSSQADTTEDFFIAPIVSDNIDQLWKDLPQILKDMNMEIKTQESGYIYALATTAWFKFVDDVEFTRHSDPARIDMKSESRVGYSDLGTNRKRLEEVRRRLFKKN